MAILVLLVHFTQRTKLPPYIFQKIITKDKKKKIAKIFELVQERREILTQSSEYTSTIQNSFQNNRLKLKNGPQQNDVNQRVVRRWKKLGVNILAEIRRKKQVESDMMKARVFKNLLNESPPSPLEDVKLLWVAVVESIDRYLFITFFFINTLAAVTFLIYLPLATRNP